MPNSLSTIGDSRKQELREKQVDWDDLSFFYLVCKISNYNKLSRVFLLTEACLGTDIAYSVGKQEVPRSVRTALEKLGALLITLTVKTSYITRD